jgi:hypothetical protein
MGSTEWGQICITSFLSDEPNSDPIILISSIIEGCMTQQYYLIILAPTKMWDFLCKDSSLCREVERSSLSCYSLPASMGSSSSSLGRLARFTNWPILKWKEWVSIFKLASYMIWSLIFICYHHPHHVWWNIFSTLNRNNLLILDHYQGCICKILNSSEL